MSSSHGDKRSSDVEMGEATSPAPFQTSLVEAPACVADHLSFRERLVRRQAEMEQVRAGAEFPSSSALAIAPGHGTEVVTPRDEGTLAGSGVPDASALSDSFGTPSRSRRTRRKREPVSVMKLPESRTERSFVKFRERIRYRQWDMFLRSRIMSGDVSGPVGLGLGQDLVPIQALLERAMDSGITSLSGAVAWASDSESLFVEPSGVL
ncbi:hypothetical protein DY000_02015749 [Brassica cretica]|uniref:Uncharacterized protein n=1 Tax=Brassica cretica TaxID=69181 RepID=A0ABQ7D380_BRACR|nr:hypothetical protein DY000_02015749 [Brassica cretica]